MQKRPGLEKERFCNEQAAAGFQGERQFAKQVAEIMTKGRIAMSGHDVFERILSSLYDAMLDDTRWPDTSALIDAACGKLVFALFAALAEFERELIRERTLAGLTSARARGRKGGRPHALSKAQVRLAQAAMAQRDTKVSELCLELGVTKATIYRYVAPDGSLRNRGRQVLARQAVPRAALNVRFCSVTVGTPC